ncbi:MAG UNVERIFIED_CONTAM: hypothetical protein LVT10_14090 [Anaerolineae bacterium]
MDAPLIKETRQNHALEHATLHLLAGRVGKLRVAGHQQYRVGSSWWGTTPPPPLLSKSGARCHRAIATGQA